jgi:hypothetical protein
MPMPQNDFENGIRIEFWIDDHIHAIRYSIVVPTIGDEVRFNDVAYKIHYRIFIYDEPSPRVAVNMEAVEHQMQPTDGTSRQKRKSKSKASPAKKDGSPISG